MMKQSLEMAENSYTDFMRTKSNVVPDVKGQYHAKPQCKGMEGVQEAKDMQRHEEKGSMKRTL